MKLNRLFSLLTLVALCCLWSCQLSTLGDVDRSEYSAEYALPLVNTTFSMNDVLDNFEENSTLTVLPDGLLRLQYSGSVLTETADDVLEEINQTLETTGIIPITSQQQSLPFTFPDGLSIDQMNLKEGTLLWNFENCSDQPIDIVLSFPTVQLNGEPLVIERTLNPAVMPDDCTSLNNVFAPVNLSGYVITTEDGFINVNYSATDPAGNQVDPSSGTNVFITGLAFSYAEGYLGQILHSSGDDRIDIDFFDNWLRGDVWFEDPTITFNIENSFGIPARSVINKFDIITVDGDTLQLQSPFVENGIDFPFPTLENVGQAVDNDFTFNKDNSNIREVLGAGPVAIEYNVDAETNPDGDPDIIGFVTDSSYYRVRVDVDLPLFGWAVNFGVRDTFALNLTDFDRVDKAEIKMVAQNGMAVGIGLQGYFLDADGVILDSLYADGANRIIQGAPVDGMGTPTGIQETITFSKFTQERFQKIKPAVNLAMVATFFTTTDGAQAVRILSDNAVDIKVGAILGISEE